MKNNVLKLGTIVVTFMLSGCSLIGGGSGEKVKSKKEAEAAMKEFGTENGYEITMEYKDDDGDSGEFTTGQKGNIYWAYTVDDSGTDKAAYIINDDGPSYKYEFEDNAWVFVDEEEITTDQITQAFSSYLYYAQGAAGLKKSGTETVCGRTCDTYKFSLGGLLAMVGAKLEYSLAVDQELGITLRLDVSGGSGEDSGSLSIRTKSFKTGAEVVAPTLPEPTPSED